MYSIHGTIVFRLILLCNVLLCLVYPQMLQASANVPVIRVAEVFTGTIASPQAQYVRLRFLSQNGNENQLAGYSVLFIDTSGAIKGIFQLKNFQNNTFGGGILLASESAQLLFHVSADVLIDGLSLPSTGAVCIKGPYNPSNSNFYNANGRVVQDCFFYGLSTSIDLAQNFQTEATYCGNGTVEGLTNNEVCDDGDLNGFFDESNCTLDCQWHIAPGPSALISNSYCGDGIVDPNNNERCDNGANNGISYANANAATTACSANCYSETAVYQGNQYVFDVFPTVYYAALPPATTPGCGDGLLQFSSPCDANGCLTGQSNVIDGEVCDDNNTVNGDGCSNACKIEDVPFFTTNQSLLAFLPKNKILQRVKNAGLTSQNSLTAFMMRNKPWPQNNLGVVGYVTSTCGNGIVEGLEDCDSEDRTVCDSNCHFALDDTLCANGSLDRGESCDDGNYIDGDGCSSRCQWEDLWGSLTYRPSPICGNGVLEVGEACDNGNPDNITSDCLSGACGSQVCGNGVLELGEQCDLGALNGNSTASCSSQCQWLSSRMTSQLCGNSRVDPGEECDLGSLNGQLSSMCDSNCLVTVLHKLYSGSCGDGRLDPSEYCDDGANNGSSQSNCTQTCCFKVPPTDNAILTVSGTGSPTTGNYYDNTNNTISSNASSSSTSSSSTSGSSSSSGSTSTSSDPNAGSSLTGTMARPMNQPQSATTVSSKKSRKGCQQTPLDSYLAIVAYGLWRCKKRFS